MRPFGRARLVTVLAAIAAAPADGRADLASQSRICRSLLPVINARDAKLKVIATTPIGQADAVSVSYDVTVAGAPRTRSRKLVCAFAKRRPGPDELMLVSSDGRMLGVPRLTFLKRYYLQSRDAALADDLLELPPTLELQRPKGPR